MGQIPRSTERISCTNVKLCGCGGVETGTAVVGTEWGCVQRQWGRGEDGYGVHGAGRDGVQFLSLCRPQVHSIHCSQLSSQTLFIYVKITSSQGKVRTAVVDKFTSNKF